ncbi:MAG: GNAT family N-acetyltransferase [Solirubrobacteraceae bacterium]
MTIRPATDADSAAVAEIWERGWRDGHHGHVPDELVTVRTPESFRVRAPARVGDTVVAVVDDAIAGFVMVAGDEVEQVYVARAHRGTGVAGMLLSAAEQAVAINGHQRAWLAVVDGNARARRFYERQGWIDDGPVDYPAATAGGALLVHAHRYVKPVASGT